MYVSVIISQEKENGLVESELPLLWALRRTVCNTWRLHRARLGYLEGQGDLVGRLIIPITHIVILIMPITNLLAWSP